MSDTTLGYQDPKAIDKNLAGQTVVRELTGTSVVREEVVIGDPATSGKMAGVNEQGDLKVFAENTVVVLDQILEELKKISLYMETLNTNVEMLLNKKIW